MRLVFKSIFAKFKRPRLDYLKILSDANKNARNEVRLALAVLFYEFTGYLNRKEKSNILELYKNLKIFENYLKNNGISTEEPN